MTVFQIYLEESDNEKISKLIKKWKLSKHETIKRIIREFKENPNGNNR